jgi:signal transduction histidine kinase
VGGLSLVVAGILAVLVGVAWPVGGAVAHLRTWLIVVTALVPVVGWARWRLVRADRAAEAGAEALAAARAAAVEDREELAEDRQALESAVVLARDLVRAVDVAEIIEMLQDALRRWWPAGEWLVMRPEETSQLSVTWAPKSTLLRDMQQMKADQTLPESSGTIVASYLEQAAQKAVFTLGDASAVYAVVLAERTAIDQKRAARTEIFLRVAVSSLRSASLLDSLVTSEKLAAVGRLAAGLAHEINNPLAFVLMNLRLLAESNEGSLREAAGDALDGAERIGQIVQGMKLLSHSEALNIETVDMAAVAARTAKVAHARNLTIPVHVDADEPVWVRGDEIRIGQILLNLMTNAVDAAQGDGRPEVTVRVRADRNLGIAEVEDNGRGIPERIRGRLFEAGFTTKGKRGMGLGLRISRSFARAQQGDLMLVSTSGKGSVFRLSLPVGADAPKTPIPAARPASTVPPATGDRPLILIVDDEPSVVRALQRWFGRNAEVLATTNPHEGQRLALSTDFDLLLCDLNMPYLQGPDLIREVTKQRPDLAERAVIMTGAIDEQVEGLRVVRKPLGPRDLTDLLKTAQLNHQ